MMAPLAISPMPTHAVIVGIDTANSWQTGTPQQPVRACYIATDSTHPVAFVTLQADRNPYQILRAATRAARFDDMPSGLVIELYLTQDLNEGETVYLSFAQSGATTYFPPQPIDDAP